MALLLVMLGHSAIADRIADTDFMPAVVRGDLSAIREQARKQPGLLEHLSAQGKTALQVAIENHHLSAVRLLLQLGADPDQSGQGMLRPLHFSVINRQLHVMHLLLREGVSLEARDTNGMTALMYAVRQDNDLFARTLLRAGARVDGLQPGNWSPLMQAAVQGSQSMVNLLLRYGAFRERVSVYGLTAAQAAEKKGFIELARQLQPD